MPKNKKKTANQFIQPIPAWEDGSLAEEDLKMIIDAIEEVDIPLDDKFFYLYAIMKGAFTMELYDELMGKIEKARQFWQKEVRDTERELKDLNQQLESHDQKIAEQAALALGQIKAGIEHVEEKTFAEAERRKVSLKEEKIKTIKQKLSKKNDRL
ncbi:MAG: hypothetical protein Q8P95_04355 [bacterium]|nr:hypothetical protein [bacterium]